MTTVTEAWLARVRHDLVKRMVWPARDRRELGGGVSAGELVAKLVDDEGQPARAGQLWQALLAEAPPAVSHELARAFAAALNAAEDGAQNDQLAPVLALEAALDELACSVKGT